MAQGTSSGRGRKASDRDSVSVFCAEIKRLPRLTKEETAALAARYQQHGDTEALGKLVTHNLLFGVQYATTFRWTGIDRGDLIGLANIGLLQAAKRFDGSKGATFISYATWWIRQAILGEASSYADAVETPAYWRKLHREYVAIRAELRAELGHAPSPEEISERSGIKRSVIKLLETKPAVNRGISLSEPLGEDGDREFGDTIADPKTVNPLDTLHTEDTRKELYEALMRLTPRQITVLTYTFGLQGEPHLTLQEIGKRIGCSRERARQIQSTAVRLLGNRINELRRNRTQAYHAKKKAELEAEQERVRQERAQRRAEREAARKARREKREEERRQLREKSLDAGWHFFDP